MGELLFRRAWSLIVAPPSQVALGREYSSSPQQGLPLRLAFQVQRSLDHKSNKATISLYNLATATAASIQPGSIVILKVGYGQRKLDVSDTIFYGEVAERSTEMQGPDVATHLACTDSEPLLQQAHVQVAFGKTSVAQVLSAIVAQLKNVSVLGVAEMRGVALSNIRNPILPRWVDAGPAGQVLQRLLSKRGFDWSFQNGRLIVSHPYGPQHVSATVVSPATGLIERPSVSKKGVAFRALIQPTLAPPGVAQLRSSAPECNGNFRICEASFQGDTHGGDWVAQCYGEAFSYLGADYTPPSDQNGDAEAAAVPADADAPEMDEGMVAG